MCVLLLFLVIRKKTLKKNEKKNEKNKVLAVKACCVFSVQKEKRKKGKMSV